jgi:hypothetical protein
MFLPPPPKAGGRRAGSSYTQQNFGQHYINSTDQYLAGLLKQQFGDILA